MRRFTPGSSGVPWHQASDFCKALQVFVAIIFDFYGLHSEFNSFEASFVDAFKLNAEEHSGDIGKNEWFIFLDHNILNIAHLVEANEHIALGCDVHKLGVSLVVERHKLQFAVRAFHGLLTVLGVVLQAAVSELISLVVLIDEVLRAVKVEVLRTEARVEREKDFLCHVHGVRRGDGFRQFHVVAVFGRDSTRGDFGLKQNFRCMDFSKSVKFAA